MAASNISPSQLGPSYSFLLGMEENFDFSKSKEMFIENWHIPYMLAILFYLPTLYIGQKIMRNMEPLNLRIPMIFWNLGLSVFSTIGFLRVIPEMLYTLDKFGFQHTICDNSYIHVKQARFWIYLFVLSKTPELGDTIFLVLRKQKLTFLHVYHHASVLIFSWFVYSNTLATARWFCVMNFGVHSIMYTYYFLKALPNVIRIPRWVSMVITSLQSIQMVMGAYVVSAAFHSKITGKDCATSMTMSFFSILIYVSYLFLFLHFFYNAYCLPPKPRDGKNVPATDKKRA